MRCLMDGCGRVLRNTCDRGAGVWGLGGFESSHPSHLALIVSFSLPSVDPTPFSSFPQFYSLLFFTKYLSIQNPQKNLAQILPRISIAATRICPLIPCLSPQFIHRLLNGVCFPKLPSTHYISSLVLCPSSIGL